MRQWADGNEFNSFNPWKALLYRDKFEKIVAGTVPVPVQARIDPTLKCPLACKWCNSARYRPRMDELTREHVEKVLDFIAYWGVRGVVWAGGGEPTRHPNFVELLNKGVELGMDAAILSNGVFPDTEVAREVGKNCLWAGISVDAGTAECYWAAKGSNQFDNVVGNIKAMAKEGKCRVGYKFLISPLNQHEIYRACIIARNIGATDFIARPMDTRHQGMVNAFDVRDFDADDIYGQFDACHELETPDFHVYTVMHKFNVDFSHGKPFTQCYGAPLRLHIATDGNVYFCDDQYYQEEYRLGSTIPDPYQILNFWGKGRHKQLLYGNTPSRCTTRCCVSNCCVACEKVFADGNDAMCINYP